MLRFKGDERRVQKRVEELLFECPDVLLDDLEELDDLLEVYAYLLHQKRACTRPLTIPRVSFDPSTWSEQDFVNDFRFNHESVTLLARFIFDNAALDQKERTANRDSFHPVEGVCIFLRVLMNGGRLCDQMRVFGRSVSAISNIANHVATVLSRKATQVLSNIDEERLSSQSFVDAFAGVIGYDARITFLVDCKLWETCDFVAFRGGLYNGDKKRDGIKSIHLVGPDGMCYFMAGPYYGARHDAGCFGEAGLPILVERLWRNRQVRGYGDSAFPRSNGLWTNFKRNQLAPGEREVQAPHDHRRYGVSLLSSAWGQVGPPRTAARQSF